MFRVLCFATPQNAPFLPFSRSSLMTGACHHLCPVLVLIEDRLQAPKAFPSIAGAKIRINPVSTKFRHVIRSDFQQTYDLKVSLKKQTLCFVGAHLYVLQYKNYVLLYKSAYYKVITCFTETCSVFSIQFFSLLLPLSV